MTWQKVTAVQAEADLKVSVNGNESAEVVNGSWGDRPTYTLEKKSGDTYDLTSYCAAMTDTTAGVEKIGDTRNGNTAMADDIAEALADGEEVWADVHFGDSSYVMYWSTDAPWDGGEVRDNYGIKDTY